jgi:hypothetical protein
MQERIPQGGFSTDALLRLSSFFILASSSSVFK